MTAEECVRQVLNQLIADGMIQRGPQWPRNVRAVELSAGDLTEAANQIAQYGHAVIAGNPILRRIDDARNVTFDGWPLKMGGHLTCWSDYPEGSEKAGICPGLPDPDDGCDLRIPGPGLNDRDQGDQLPPEFRE